MVDAVRPGELEQLSRFRQGKSDILIVPVQLGLVGKFNFCHIMYHFEVIPDPELSAQVERLVIREATITTLVGSDDYDSALVEALKPEIERTSRLVKV